VATLSPDFERRAPELRELGRVEDIREVLTHLGLALDANELWAEWSLESRRAAILRALPSAILDG
jgi:hypothetical protein